MPLAGLRLNDGAGADTANNLPPFAPSPSSSSSSELSWWSLSSSRLVGAVDPLITLARRPLRGESDALASRASDASSSSSSSVAPASRPARDAEAYGWLALRRGVRSCGKGGARSLVWEEEDEQDQSTEVTEEAEIDWGEYGEEDESRLCVTIEIGWAAVLELIFELVGSVVCVMGWVLKDASRGRRGPERVCVASS